MPKSRKQKTPSDQPKLTKSDVSEKLVERTNQHIGLNPDPLDSQWPPQIKSLFVHSLAKTVTTESLTRLFSNSYPLKHATVVQDPLTKVSKGYGFVTFADSDDAKRARDSLDGSLWEGRLIKIKPAEPRNRSGTGDDKTNPRRTHPSQLAARTRSEHIQGTSEGKRPPKLIVRNLPWTIKEPGHLAALFQSYGKVKQVTMPKKKAGLSAGFGFVMLRGRRNAENALQGMNGTEIEGRILAVDWAVEKEIWETAQKSPEIGHFRHRSSRESPSDILEASGPRKAMLNDNDSTSDNEVMSDSDETGPNNEDDTAMVSDEQDQKSRPKDIDASTSTCFIRNLPFNVTDETLKDHFSSFGPVRYSRVVLDPITKRSRGTGFVCFYRQEDAEACLRESPRPPSTPGQRRTTNGGSSLPPLKQSLLEDLKVDCSGRYTFEGRLLQVSRAVNKSEAMHLMAAGRSLRDAREKDRRCLYLLSEGTISQNTPLYAQLSLSEIKLREGSAKQRQTLIKNNPALHLSLTRLSVRNLPRGITSKTLKALAREAVVGFASDVKAGLRKQLSKEELLRGGAELREAASARKAKRKGIVRQAKVVFESREGKKVSEESGAGRSRGYGFIEYTSHRWALMGLRWLNGYAVENAANDAGGTLIPGEECQEIKKRLIVEFAIENAQVVGRRQEREAKARERSKLIFENREKGELPSTGDKSLSRDTIMARTRKGVKRKRDFDERPDVQFAASLARDRGNAHSAHDPGELAKRQRIIGKKRMIRISRKGASAS